MFYARAPAWSGTLHCFFAALYYRNSKCTDVRTRLTELSDLFMFSRWKGVWIIEGAAEGEAGGGEQGKGMNGV